ncbi:MAG: hypothetical protein FWE76_05975, partial [Symbiobacteriaceae bacterium]|nr:hypothetical protein [Symbiobacteriaceae bacterium]
MHRSIIRFLYARGSRPAAGRGEGTALRYMATQFETLGIATQNSVFPSFSTSAWYYAFAYAFFPLATIVYIVSIPLALLLVTMGILLLRLDLFIWPFINRMFALTSRSGVVTGRIPPLRETLHTVVITANADNRSVLWPISKWPALERLSLPLLFFVDLARVLQFLAYLVATGLDAFNLQSQVMYLWSISRISGVLSLITVCGYLAQGMHSRPVNCANDNLSGMQILMDLASEISQNPFQNTEVVLATVGSSLAGALGTQHLIRTCKPDRESTFFFNISAVGCGRVSMAGSEGTTRPIPVTDDLTALGYFIGSNAPYALEVVNTRQRRSDCSMARTLGYR